jgi:AbrB family looped-hinge helix DNA binding protein
MGNPTSEKHSKVYLGVQGRLVIPAGMRRRLDLNPGDMLVARVEDNRLVIEKVKVMKRRGAARRAPTGNAHDCVAVDMAAELIEGQCCESSNAGDS